MSWGDPPGGGFNPYREVTVPPPPALPPEQHKARVMAELDAFFTAR